MPTPLVPDDEAATCVISEIGDVDDLIDTQRLVSVPGQATTDIAIMPIELPGPQAPSEAESHASNRHRRKQVSSRMRVRRRGSADTTLIAVAIASMAILILVVLIVG